MNFFKAPEVLERLERLIQLMTDRGSWVRLGTGAVAASLIAVGTFILVRREAAQVGSEAVKLVGKVV